MNWTPVWLALTLFTSPMAGASFCPSGLVVTHYGHELGHDVAAVLHGQTPPNAFAVAGDKWSETQPGFERIARAGLVAQTWLAAVALEPCTARGNTTIQAIYLARSSFDSDTAEAAGADRLGDYRPIHNKGAFGWAGVLTGVALEGLAKEHRERWGHFLLAD